MTEKRVDSLHFIREIDIWEDEETASFCWHDYATGSSGEDYRTREGAIIDAKAIFGETV